MSLRVVVMAPDKLDLADELQDEFKAEAKAAVKEGAQLLLSEIQRLLRLRSGPAGMTAPEGEPPEKHTAALLESFRLLPPRVSGAVASSGIISRHPGANRQEFGYTDIRGVRTLPHPFLRPAIAATEGKMSELLTERLAS
jgi:hypothetical protein